MNWKILSSTLHLLCKIQYLFLLWKIFWLRVKTEMNEAKKLNFSDKLFSYQEPLFALSKFSWNPVALSGELVAFEWFFQTRCLGRSIQLINFLRQSVSIKGGFVQLERFPQTSCCMPLVEISFEHNHFSKWNKLINNSPYDQYLLSCLDFLFMIGLSQGILRIWYKVMSITCYAFLAIVSFVLLQSNCCNFNFTFRIIFFLQFLDMVCLNRNEKSLCENRGTQTTNKSIVRKKRRRVQLEPCFVPRVPICPLIPRMTWNIILLRGTVRQNLSLFSSVYFIIKSFHDITPYDNIKTFNMAHLSRQQMLIQTISSTNWLIWISKENFVHVNISRRFWAYTVETQSLHLC